MNRLFPIILALWLTLAGSFIARAEEDFETVYMPRGRYQGQLLDTRDRRSVRLLEGDEAKPYRRGEGEMVITNFYHEGKFWVARFPADCVEAVFFQKVVMKTKVPAAHAQLRFKFKPGKEVELFGATGERPRDAHIPDVVYSVEAMPVYGDKYDLFNGMKDHFGLGLRIMSIQEAYFKSIYANDQHVEQIPLDVIDRAEQVLLREALTRSNEVGMGDMYNTITRSCCTESFRLLDRSSARTWLRMPAYGLVVLPILPRTYLWLRQLIDFKTLLRNPYPSLEEEFAHWKETPWWADRLAKLRARDAADRELFLARMKRVKEACDLDAFARRNDFPNHGSE